MGDNLLKLQSGLSMAMIAWGNVVAWCHKRSPTLAIAMRSRQQQNFGGSKRWFVFAFSGLVYLFLSHDVFSNTHHQRYSYGFFTVKVTDGNSIDEL